MPIEALKRALDPLEMELQAVVICLTCVLETVIELGFSESTVYTANLLRDLSNPLEIFFYYVYLCVGMCI